MKKVQFYTQINTKNGFRGAQVKTWDYYNFINSHDKFSARIAFHENSCWSNAVYWNKNDIEKKGSFFLNPDLYILKGGRDWLLYDEHFERNNNIPVISPIVNYRVLDGLHKSNILLSKKAIRVCPNPDLAHKVECHHLTNGPVVFIPHGVEVGSVSQTIYNDKQVDLLIVANKNPLMGKEIYDLFNDNKINIKLIDRVIPKNEFLLAFSASKIALHLPKRIESFYLPGMESISLGAITLMPNCLGNKFYSEDNEGIFLCDYNVDDICNSLQNLLELDDIQKKKLSISGIKKGGDFSLESEEKKWHKLLDNIDNLITLK